MNSDKQNGDMPAGDPLDLALLPASRRVKAFYLIPRTDPFDGHLFPNTPRPSHYIWIMEKKARRLHMA
jgi:hypothetical protein